MRKPDVGVVILGGGRGARLAPLTRDRSKPAVPVGGKYRLVDIPISNAILSGMTRMVLLTQYNSVSLHRHISTTYTFDAFNGGRVQILAAQQTPYDEHWFQGTADAVRQNLLYINEIAEDLVLILAGDHMYRMDYRPMVREHVEAGAEITIAVQPCTEEEIGGFGALRMSETGAITEFREKPKTPEARAGMALDAAWLAERGYPTDRPYMASMGIYLFDKRVLLAALENDRIDFGRDVIPASVAGGRRVQAHLFGGYWKDIGTVGAFYDAHMELLGDDPPFRFDDSDWPMYSHPRFLPPARISGSSFERAMLAEGTRIVDSRIEQSIIGVRTRVTGATIKGSLLMGADSRVPPAPVGAPPLGVGPGTVIERAIIDKNARIGKDVAIVNAANVTEGSGEGWAIRDSIVVIPKNTILADGTVI